MQTQGKAWPPPRITGHILNYANAATGGNGAQGRSCASDGLPRRLFLHVGQTDFDPGLAQLGSGAQQGKELREQVHIGFLDAAAQAAASFFESVPDTKRKVVWFSSRTDF
jgi:hypothetical protein